MTLVYMVFGGFAFTAGVLTYWYLEETLGKPLQDVMDEDLTASTNFDELDTVTDAELDGLDEHGRL